jgi:hypothetical protein
LGRWALRPRRRHSGLRACFFELGLAYKLFNKVPSADSARHNFAENRRSSSGSFFVLDSSWAMRYSLCGRRMKTLNEIEEAIGTLPLPDRLRLYKDMPQLIGRDAEDLDWQRLALENFFKDDSPDDEIYDRV